MFTVDLSIHIEGRHVLMPIVSPNIERNTLQNKEEMYFGKCFE